MSVPSDSSKNCVKFSRAFLVLRLCAISQRHPSSRPGMFHLVRLRVGSALQSEVLSVMVLDAIILRMFSA